MQSRETTFLVQYVKAIKFAKILGGSSTQFARSWLRPWMSLYKWQNENDILYKEQLWNLSKNQTSRVGKQKRATHCKRGATFFIAMMNRTTSNSA